MRSAGLLLAAALALAAGACRGPAAEAVSDRDDEVFSYFFYEPHEPLFVEDKDEAGRAVFRTRSVRHMSEASFARAKPAEVFRVFIVGGSVAGVYDTGAAKPGLKEVLERVLPGRRVEVVNCGLSGYNSPREKGVVREVLRYSPDLLVLMSAFNESQPGLPPAWVARLGRRLERVPGLQRPWRRLLGALYRRTIPKMPYSRLRMRLRANLTEILREASAAHVPVVLCTIPSNVRDMPPSDTPPFEDPAFLAGWVLLEAGRLREAAEWFERAGGGGPTSPTVEYHLARALDLQGRVAEARPHYEAASRLLQPLLVLNEDLRVLARAEGAFLCDLEEVFRGFSRDAITGRGLIEDQSHWFRRADPLVSVAIARALARGALPGLSPAWLDRGAPAVEKAAMAERPSLEGGWTVLRLWMHPYLWSEDRIFSEHLLSVLETLRQAGPPVFEDPVRLRRWLDSEFAANSWASAACGEFDRWWPVSLAYAGELHRRGGRYALALRFFEESLRRRPGLGKVRVQRALALLQAGEGARARAEFEASGQGGGRARRIWEAYSRVFPVDSTAPVKRESKGKP